ncbi:MAG: hypothetical protein R3F59_20550 [Myxococcota bacterium]
MLILSIVAVVANAGGATVPDFANVGAGCFPLRQAVYQDLKQWCSERVLVEEWSACEGAGSGGNGSFEPPALSTKVGGERLREIVDAYNTGGGLDYAVTQVGSVWIVRPNGVSALFDTRVDLDPIRYPMVADQLQGLKDQLLTTRGVWIGRQPGPDLRNLTPTGLRNATQLPYWEAISALNESLERVFADTQPDDEPFARFGYYLTYSDARNAASSILIRCEEKPPSSPPPLIPSE